MKKVLIVLITFFTLETKCQILKSMVYDFDGLDINQTDFPEGDYRANDLTYKIVENPLGNNEMLGDRVLQINLNWNTGNGTFGRGISRYIEFDPNQDIFNFYFYNPLSNNQDATFDILIADDDNQDNTYSQFSDDSWKKNFVTPGSSGWQLFSVPLKDFTDANTGGNGIFDMTFTQNKGMLLFVEFRFIRSTPSPGNPVFFLDMINFSEGALPHGATIFDFPSGNPSDFCLLGAFQQEKRGEQYLIPSKFESLFPLVPGKKINYVNWFLQWAMDGSTVPKEMPGNEVQQLLNNGYTPVITWEPMFLGYSRLHPVQPRLNNIINGDYNSYIDAFADKIKTYSDTVIIRFMHEFEGDWYPWSLVHNNEDPARYVTAFRKVVDRFRARGTYNVKWMWTVNSDYFPYKYFNWIVPAYPGNDYVDIVASDIYNNHYPPDLPWWRSFRWQTTESYYYLTKYFPQKPLLICEIGCRERFSTENQTSESKGEWFARMDKQLQTNYHQVRALLFFNAAPDQNWFVNSSPSALQSLTDNIWYDDYYFNVPSGPLPFTVYITSPANNITFNAGSVISIMANVSGGSGNIQKVEFFANNIKLGDDTVSPYNFTWNNATSGNYSLTAKAIDSASNTAVSSIINIIINPPFLTCNNIGAITVEVWNNVGGSSVSDIPINSSPSSISQLSIFETTGNLGDNYGQRIRGYVCPPITGNYIFWIASDDNSQLWLSNDTTASGKLLIASVPGYTSSRQWTKYSSQQSVPISLTAGRQYYIEALHKEGKQGDNLAVGWQLPNGTMERPVPGSRLSPYEVINPTVIELIAAGASWQYLDDGTNPGNEWKNNSFDDNAWKTGNAELGYGDGDEATVVSYGTLATNKYITTYFRKKFNVEDVSTISGLELGIIRDDGAVVYLNGVEVYRTNMPSGPILNNTLAPSAINGTPEITYLFTNLISSGLFPGENLMAVEIHQNRVNSSDISFNLTLKGFFSDTTIPPDTTITYTPDIFAVIGDYGLSGPNEEGVANLVKSWKPGYIITVGDNNYPDGANSTIDANIGQYYHDYIHPYTGSYGKAADTNRFFPCLGNHDFYTSSAAPYFQYFTLPGNERYYDFIRGDVHFIALDSDSSEPDGFSSTSTQAMWLKNILESSASKWKIVYFHHSPFASDLVHGNTEWMQWPFKTWGADIVLTGHSHIYERVIMDNFPYIVNALGGSVIYNLSASPVFGSQVRYNDNFGALQVKISPDTIWFKFYSINNELIDVYPLVKDATLPPEPCPETGSILREYWENVSGYSVSQIPINTATTNSSQLATFEGPANISDNYGDRIKGYICPPATGNYTFWIASDDNSELWLSPNGNSAEKVKIASVTGWTNSREWTKYPSQQSAPIFLFENNKYYIESLHKEASGGDNIAVGWQLPNGIYERPIPGSRLSPGISVPPPQTQVLIAANSQWNFLDDGSNQGIAWRDFSFNDTLWKTGNAELGYGDGDETTVVNYGPSQTGKYITTYFRKKFTISDISNITGVELSIIRDDGIVVYLNGLEVYRNNLPTSTIFYNTLAPSYIDGTNESTWITAVISSSNLVAGNNIIAVEIHQNSPSSSDISFNLKLAGIISGTNKMAVDSTSLTSINVNDSIYLSKGDFIIYPNPTTGLFTLEYCRDGIKENILQVEIFNPIGQLLFQKKLKLVNGCARGAIEFEKNIPIGMYFMNVIADGNQESKRIILTR